MRSKTLRKSGKILAMIVMSLILTVAIVIPTVLTAYGAEYYNSFMNEL